MRTFTRLFSLLAVLLPSFILANVYVHGTVKRANGTAVANYPVYIQTDSLNNNPVACQYVHTVYTNPNGFYSDTLMCSATITRVYVGIYDCTQVYVHHDYNLTAASQIVESNFIICDTVAATCHASFTWQATNLTAYFYSGSSGGAQATDSIISRTWTFGDGTSLSGNIVNPVHAYAQAGTFNVCLKIKTVSNCEKTVCYNVLVSNNSCLANFTWERIVSTNRIRFNSTTSTSVAGDSIISRKWKFGDGDSLLGNAVSPEHTYTQPGTYNACLTIKTSGGCEKTVCKVVVLASAVTCEASFTYQILTTSAGYAVKFNSSASHTSAIDSIVVRRWNFGDGTTGVGIDPTHVYTQPGNYNVCFRIETALNCGDSTCKLITIVPAQAHCEAVYTSENIAAPAGSNTALKYIRFNSANSHGSFLNDSIISRTWYFGDSSAALQGNVLSPIHGYAQSGTYNACLYILTASGCRDTICHTVVAAATTTPVNCQPRFTTTAIALSIVFNSTTTTAATGDSIISRSWAFGDGTSAGNTVNVTHQYAQVGEYTTCLTIHTRLGCVSTFCKKIAVINQAGNCVPYFTKEQVAAPIRTVRFNSTGAYSQLPNDSIVERKWEFGDGQMLSGNVISPLHTYLHGGTYNVCLKIRTAHCDGHWCQTVQVRPLDSTLTTDSIQIVNLYPVPVTTQLNAVIYSSHSNVAAELAIYDVYGVKKWSQNTTLPQGNSTYNIPTAQLANGPYIFRVTTIYGVKSKNFYKLN